MPEYLAVLAGDTASVRLLPAGAPRELTLQQPPDQSAQPPQQPPQQPPHQSAQHPQEPEAARPTASGGRLRQAFENDLVLDYLDLAEALAARFEARGRERADLNQVAYLGLVKAARGFDRSKGHSFPAYAAPTITGELKRYLRDRSWMVRPPRNIQDLRSQLFRVEPELAQELGRNPTVSELAGHLGVGADEVREAINASSSLRPDSLDAVPTHGGALPASEMLACSDTPLERLEELSCLREAMQELDAADRELLYRRYFCEETQVELGKRLGMSQMQVSRRLARVLVDLQHRLQDNSHCAPVSSAAAESTSSTVTPKRAGSGLSAKGSPRRNASRVNTT
ncbi:sigma-70 family RNA polymerase sigma factor [Pseudarthrobacter sulfonivorans]|uniref:sigma-70 family RNA polymerase sigma factor n=1 Tax=Pseudarthrobacter sulfonivorans TaxID=121292 RepID=UPI002787F436|nr:sigma-70 family RNA polymerase sigma factor [Pseudarthrobacter sulfonivorans]MDP9997276.1 RNA polymerase sigma-B factor [Pseudarthrobacter sulfonivorans]